MKRSTPLDSPDLSRLSVPLFPPEEKKEPGKCIRILIADDHAVLRRGLVTLLSLYPDLEVCAAASNSRQALELFRQYRPDIVLADLRLGAVDGVAAIKAVLEESPETRAIVMTTLPERRLISRAYAAGAVACWLKTSPLSDLVAIIRAIRSAKENGGAKASHTTRTG